MILLPSTINFFLVPASSGSKIYTYSKCISSRFEAKKKKKMFLLMPTANWRCVFLGLLGCHSMMCHQLVSGQTMLQPDEMLTRKQLFPRKNVVHQLDLMTNLSGTPSARLIARIWNEKTRRYLCTMRKKKKNRPFLSHKNSLMSICWLFNYRNVSLHLILKIVQLLKRP